MRYGKRDLRAVDMFALILFGVGVVFVVMGVVRYSGGGGVAYGKKGVPARKAMPDADRSGADAPVVKGGKGTPVTIDPVAGAIRLILLGVVFILLGGALNLGLRRVLKNKCEDVLEPHDEAGQSAESS
jgi:hypothetical protein